MLRSRKNEALAHIVNPLSTVLQGRVVAARKAPRAIREVVGGVAPVQEGVRVRVETETVPPCIDGGVHAAGIRLRRGGRSR